MRITVHNQGTHPDGLVERKITCFKSTCVVLLSVAWEVVARPMLLGYRVTTRMSVAIGNGCSVSPEVQEDLRSQGVGQGTGEYVWGRHGVYAVSFGSTTVIKTKRDRAGWINVSVNI